MESVFLIEIKMRNLLDEFSQIINKLKIDNNYKLENSCNLEKEQTQHNSNQNSFKKKRELSFDLSKHQTFEFNNINNEFSINNSYNNEDKNNDHDKYPRFENIKLELEDEKSILIEINKIEEVNEKKTGNEIYMSNESNKYPRLEDIEYDDEKSIQADLNDRFMSFSQAYINSNLKNINHIDSLNNTTLLDPNSIIIEAKQELKLPKNNFRSNSEKINKNNSYSDESLASDFLGHKLKHRSRSMTDLFINEKGKNQSEEIGSSIISKSSNHNRIKFFKQRTMDYSQIVNIGKNLTKNSIKRRKKLAYKSQLLDELCLSDYDKLDQFKYEINMATMGVITLKNNEQKILYNNNQISDKLFQERSELIGIDIFYMISDKDKELFRNELSNFVMSKQSISRAIQINFQDKKYNLVCYEITFLLKKLDLTEFIMIQLNPPSEDIWWVIDQNIPAQIYWVAFVSMVLLFISVYIPQDIVFNNSKISNLIDIPSSIIFFIDIIINFNLSYESNGVTVKDSYKIAINYLNGWFIIDALSTIPFDIIVSSFFEFQMLKSLRIFKIFRLIKLLKLFKFNKSSIDFVSKDELSRDLQKFIKSNQGQFDLLKNMSYILIFAHQYSIIYYLMETKIICKSYLQCWQNAHQMNQDLHNNIYLFILFDCIKIALGLSSPVTFNEIEMYLSLFWMFLGLSLQGQGIGNISAQLSFTNKQELEQMQTQSFFSELCFMYNIDSRLTNIVMEQIDTQQSKFMDRELLQQNQVIPQYIFEQIENNLYNEYINLFPLFKKLNITSLRNLKHNSQFDTQKVLLRKGFSVKALYFILDGNVNVYDENMLIVSWFGKHEIQGLSEFFEQMKHKQLVDIESIMGEHVLEVEKQLQMIFKSKYIGNKDVNAKKQSRKITNQGSMKSISSNQIDEMLKNSKDDNNSLLQKLQKEFSHINTSFKMQISPTDNYLISNLNVYSSDNIRYIQVPYTVVEEILFEDLDSFQQIQKYQNIQNREITQEESEESRIIISNFENYKPPTLLIKCGGDIYDVNESFMKVFDVKFEDMIDVNISTLVQSKNNYGNFENLNFEELSNIDENKEIQFKVDSKYVKITFVIGEEKKIIDQDRTSLVKRHQMTSAKCLLQVQTVQFQVSHQNNNNTEAN